MGGSFGLRRFNVIDGFCQPKSDKDLGAWVAPPQQHIIDVRGGDVIVSAPRAGASRLTAGFPDTFANFIGCHERQYAWTLDSGQGAWQKAFTPERRGANVYRQ